MVGIGIAVAGALSAGSSLLGSSAQSSASSQAAQEQLQATQESIAAQQQFFNEDKAILQPFVNAGYSANGQLSSLLGINPSGAAGAQQTLENLPGYQFTYGQGQQAENASITARGLGLSGAQVRGASDYAQGAASQNYNQYVSQLMGFMGLGENAAAGVGSGALQTGAGVGNSLIQGGNALAAGTIGSANAYASGLAGVGNAAGGAIQGYAGYNAYMNGQGGGGSNSSDPFAGAGATAPGWGG